MPLPLAAILSAVTPLVLSAYELYRRRREANAGPAGAALSGEGWRTRLRELEASDLEQARLIDELSRSVESLARAVEAALEENRRQAAQFQRRLWALGSFAGLAFGVALWALLR